MAMGFLKDGDTTVVATEVVTTLRCSNPNCNAVIAQGHFMGLGAMRVLCCPLCKYGSEFEITARGWTVKLLAKQFVPRAMKRET